MKFIKNHCFAHYIPWAIWLCGGLFYCYQFVLRVSPSIMTTELMRAFQVNGYALGILSAFYYYAYDALQIPLGFIMDRFGPRRVLTCSTAICVAGSFIFASATTLSFASIGRLLMGAGSACAFIGTLKLATLWFPPPKVGKIIGFTMVLGTIGATSGGAPLAFLLEYIGWRASLFLISGLGVLLALTMWLVIRDKNVPSSKEGFPPSARELGKGLSQLLRTSQFWFIAIYSSLMYVPLSAFADLWGVPYLSAVYSLERKIAASAIAMIFLGIAVASPITTYLSDYFQTRRLPMIFAALCSFILYTIIVFVPVSLSLMYVLLFLAGVSFTGQLLGFAAICEIIPASMSGLTLGLTNMTVMLSGVIFQPFIGWALDKAWDGKIEQGIPYFTLENWKLALGSILLCLFLALLLTCFIRETFAKNHGSS
jgi:MFS family permease